MIKLTIQKGISNLNGEPQEYFKVGIQAGPVVTLEKIARKISDNTGYKEQQVKGILESQWQAIFDELEDGQSVQLGGITLRPSLSVVAHKTAEECSVKDVKAVRFIAQTTKDLNAMRKQITFSFDGNTSTEDVALGGDEELPDGGNPASGNGDAPGLVGG